MTIFDKGKAGFTGQPKAKSSKEIIDEFFYSFHPVEVEESLRELLRIIVDKRITVTDSEKEDFAYFLQRLSDLVKASYSLRS